MGDGIRLYFEAEGTDRKTHVMHLDSQDGFAGLDFHRGAAVQCASITGFAPGGGCEPVVDLGDNEPRVRNARQFKIGYPTLGSTLGRRAVHTGLWRKRLSAPV
jgi:hypothetical protein